MHANNLYCNSCVNYKLFKVNIVTKILSLLVFMFFSIFNKHLLFSFFYLITLLFLFKVAGLKLKTLFKYLTSLWYIDLFLVLLLIFVKNLELFFLIFINLQLIFSFLFYIYISTSSNEIRKLFISFFTPLKNVKINICKLSDICLNFINFFPEYSYNVSVVSKSEKSRGVDIWSVDIRTKFIALMSIYKNGFNLTLRNMRKRRKMKDFMLYDKNKKIERIKSNYELNDLLFIFIHVGLIILIYFQEEVYYEIFTKFFI